MIKQLKIITKWIAAIVSKVYSYNIHIRFCVLKDEFYSFWIISTLGIKSTNVMIKKGTWLDGAQYIHIADDVTICRNSLIEAKYLHNGIKYSPNIFIGQGSYIGSDNHITIMGDLRIGKHLLTGRHVLISDNNHGKISFDDLHLAPGKRSLSTHGSIQIGDNVWIGENACVLGGVSIGNGSVIAANAVVTHDVPDYALVAGVPARIIKILK